MSLLGRTLGVIAFCAYAHLPQLASDGVAYARTGAGEGAGRDAAIADPHLISMSAIGHVRLRMTLDEARHALPGASFSRTTDGDGAALVEIAFGHDNSLSVWAEEDDPATPIDWSKRIVTIETFSAGFHTREGIHPGSLVAEAARFFGPVREIVKSEIESREYVTFSRQPRALTFRLDYTGIFTPGLQRTTSFAPGAKIWSIAISSASAKLLENGGTFTIPSQSAEENAESGHDSRSSPALTT